jgi:hypothetical protein
VGRHEGHDRLSFLSFRKALFPSITIVAYTSSTLGEARAAKKIGL